MIWAYGTKWCKISVYTGSKGGASSEVDYPRRHSLMHFLRNTCDYDKALHVSRKYSAYIACSREEVQLLKSVWKPTWSPKVGFVSKSSTVLCGSALVVPMSVLVPCSLFLTCTRDCLDSMKGTHEGFQKCFRKGELSEEVAPKHSKVQLWVLFLQRAYYGFHILQISAP